MPQTTVLITGANRGLGLGLAQAYAALPNHTVIAACRTPSSCPSIEAASGSKVLVVKYDAGEAEDAKKMIEELKSKGVEKLDIVIANAAIMPPDCVGKLSEVSPKVFEETWRVNVLGQLILWQACVPVLPAGSKFVWMSSGASIIDREPDKEDAAYGITKSSMNYLARYSHFENPEIVTFSLSPGWVQTDMGNYAARGLGLKEAPTTIKESVDGMVKVIGDATRDNGSGYHMRYNGTKSKW